MDEKDLRVAQHMITHCDRIARYLDRCGNSLEIFMHDELLQDGMTMQLLAMGELTTHFSEEFRAEYPTEIDWRNLKQLRNVCAHRYGTLDYRIIWEIVTAEVPQIKTFFTSVCAAEPDSPETDAHTE